MVLSLDTKKKMSSSCQRNKLKIYTLAGYVCSLNQARPCAIIEKFRVYQEPVMFYICFEVWLLITGLLAFQTIGRCDLMFNSFDTIHIFISQIPRFRSCRELPWIVITKRGKDISPVIMIFAPLRLFLGG